MMPRSPTQFPSIGIGAGSLANAKGETAFLETIRTAWTLGVRYFDTSSAYLGGDSERRLGRALQDFPRDELILSTKLGRYQNYIGSSLEPGQADNYHFDFSADAARKSVEQSLERLGVDYLNAVYIHDLDPRFAKDAYHDLFQQAVTEAYPALQRLKQEKVIGAIGAASMDWRACLKIAEAVDLDVVMPAGEYSLLRTQCSPLLDFCRRNDIAWIAAAPFNSGILATGPDPRSYYCMRPATPEVLEQTAQLQAICDRNSVPLAAAALQFPLRNPAVKSVVFGAKTSAEFLENHGLFQQHLPEAFWTEMETFVADTADWEGPQPEPST